MYDWIAFWPRGVGPSIPEVPSDSPPQNTLGPLSAFVKSIPRKLSKKLKISLDLKPCG